MQPLFEVPFERAPWTKGELKSALQKYLRRGFKDAALSAAVGLLAVEDGFNTLRMRLPVIVGEDLGWEWMSRFPMDKPFSSPATIDDWLSTVASLALVPKSKEAYWLWMMGLEAAKTNGVYSRTAIKDAVAAKDYVEVARLATLGVPRDLNGLCAATVELAREAPAFAKAVVMGSLWRQKYPAGDWDRGYWAVGALLAIVDGLEGPPVDWPDESVEQAEIPVLSRLEWYVLDGHTGRGRKALQAVAWRHGMSDKLLAELMFSYESGVVFNEKPGARWTAEGLALTAQMEGWGSNIEGAALWAKLSSEVQQEIEGIQQTRFSRR